MLTTCPVCIFALLEVGVLAAALAVLGHVLAPCGAGDAPSAEERRENALHTVRLSYLRFDTIMVPLGAGVAGRIGTL